MIKNISLKKKALPKKNYTLGAMRNRKIKPILEIVGMSVLLFTVVLTMTTGVANAEPTAMRTLPDEPVPAGETFTVRIEVAEYGSYGQVAETLPEGFCYLTSSLIPEWVTVEGETNTVRFTLFGKTSFTYTVKAPDTEGTYTISGILKDEDKNEYEVSGDTEIAVGEAKLTSSPSPTTIPTSLEIALEPGEYKLEFSARPGDLVSKDLILTNDRDSPAYNLSHTPVVGNATDMIRIKPELIEEISPSDEEKYTINVFVPEDQELGNYTGHSYFFFSSTGFPPPIPFKVDFSVSVLPEEVKEIHGIDLKIDAQDKVAVKNVTSNETASSASFKITVINTGMYFDVMQIEEPEFENGEGWEVWLYDEEEEVTDFPHEILLNAGKEHDLMLSVTGTTPGTNLTVEITGKSSANVTKMDSVRSITYIKPEKEVVNATKIEP